MSKIKNALISLSDKEKLKSILEVLRKNKVNIISSGRTYISIKKLGFKCKEVSQFTGFEEMLDGRVKTLHPKIHSGILFKRDKKTHRKQMQKKRFEPIDLVIVNFYPFEAAIKKLGGEVVSIHDEKMSSVAPSVVDWVAEIVVKPLTSFFIKNGVQIGVLLISFILLFKMGEAFMGRMSVIFYSEIGFSKSDIAVYSKGIGWITTLLFTLLGSFFVIKGGRKKKKHWEI